MEYKKRSINDYIFDFVYRSAMNDATMQNAYTGSKDELLKNPKAKNIVRAYINSIFSSDAEQNVFNYDFYNIANELKNEFIDYPDFTFGNIQKLINMTAKYFFISTYNEENKNIFSKCHCPMDSIMIKAVVDKYKKLIKNDKEQSEKKLEYFCYEGKKTKDWSKISWSKISDEKTKDRTSIDVYKNYQEMVNYLANKRYMPLEMDFILYE